MKFIIVVGVIIAAGYFLLLSMSTNLVLTQTQAIQKQYESAAEQAEAIASNTVTP